MLKLADRNRHLEKKNEELEGQIQSGDSTMSRCREDLHHHKNKIDEL
jgi:cell division septum initiation protein DivIVA